MIVLYYFLCFSDAMPDPATQNIMGMSCIFTVSAHIILNISVLMRQSIIDLRTRCRRRRMQKQLKKKLTRSLNLNEIVDMKKLQHVVEESEPSELMESEE